METIHREFLFIRENHGNAGEVIRPNRMTIDKFQRLYEE